MSECICNQGFGMNLSCPEHPTRFVPRAYADRLEALRKNHDQLLRCLRTILADLPLKRDWLDPELEHWAREAIRDGEAICQK
jgi:hypothetical protein